MSSDRHRVAFFKLLRVINLNCFDALLKLPPQQFKLIMDSIVWATKHTMRDIERLVKVENSLQDARYRNRSATRSMEDLLEG